MTTPPPTYEEKLETVARDLCAAVGRAALTIHRDPRPPTLDVVFRDILADAFPDSGAQPAERAVTLGEAAKLLVEMGIEFEWATPRWPDSRNGKRRFFILPPVDRILEEYDGAVEFWVGAIGEPERFESLDTLRARLTALLSAESEGK